MSRLYHYMLEPNYFDERVQDWPLTSGRAAILVVALYMVGVPLARQAMANCKPVDVSRFVWAHNVAMALLSLWMLIATVKSQYECAHWDKKLRIWGTVAQPGKTFTPACHRLAVAMYVHYLSKVWEFVDTFIMILKRNDHQISFLHVYHHATTFLCWWASINFAPGGDTYFVCAINSFVHVLMYSYYLAASSKAFRIPVLLKKSITCIQLIQFVFVLAQATFGLTVATYYRPRIIIWLALSQAVIFMILFGNFFRKSYAQKRSRTVHPSSKATAVKSSAIAAAAGIPLPRENGVTPAKGVTWAKETSH